MTLGIRIAPFLALLAAAPVAAQPMRHRFVTERVAGMVGDPAVVELAARHELDVVNVMWEDTGRFHGSSVGPNISDVTIEVEVADQAGQQTFLMPVIRHPNFSDLTGDVDIDELFVKVGNHEQGRALEVITLRQLLAEPLRYMSAPRNGRIRGGSLLARRDDKVLVSAQSAFLPIPRRGAAKFYPVVFNYQSWAKHPAVLTILVTRQGSSMTAIDNDRDTVGGSWGQRLYLNAGGRRAPLSAERLADVVASGTTQNGESAASLGDDANVMMIIQVPLKVAAQRMQMAGDGAMAEMTTAPMAAAAPSAAGASERRRSDIDAAVIGHGPTEGPYRELDGLTIERDPRFPVRVTVQFYQATSNGVAAPADVRRIARQIQKVYRKADYVGSLVLDADTPRPTRWDGAGRAPAALSYRDFPGLLERYGRIRRSLVVALPW